MCNCHINFVFVILSILFLTPTPFVSVSDFNLCTADELKAMEKDIRNSVQDSLTAAKAGEYYC